MSKKQYEDEIKEKLEKTIIKELKEVDKIKDLKERMIKFDYLFNVSKILDNYTILEPILTKFFIDKKRKDRQIQNESWDSIEK